MTPEKLAELRALAERATPGPWKNDCGNGQVETEKWRILICERVGDSERKKDAEYMFPHPIEEVEALLKFDNEDDMEFIAAFNPQTAIELLDEIKGLEAQLAILNEKMLVKTEKEQT